MNQPVNCQLIDNGAALAIELDNGTASRYHAIWLRDNADDPGVKDPSSGQRLHSIASIDQAVTIRHAELETDKVRLQFSDGTNSSTSIRFLTEHNYDHGGTAGPHPEDKIYWQAELDPNSLSADFSAVSVDNNALHQWLNWVATYGFARLHGVPIQSGAVFSVAELFGYIRETNYGRLFEVKARADAENLAFTSAGLDPHTDNPYRDPVPTLQLLHCLEKGSEGGDSVLVDGIASAMVLRQESEAHFDLLVRYPVPFVYCGDNVSDLRANQTLISVDADNNIRSVRLNNRSMDAPTSIPYNLLPEFYKAYAHFVEITLRPAMQIQFAQNAGDLFIVDNTRVLHGRRSFQASGNRWLQGAYADIDGLLSKLRVLERDRTTPINSQRTSEQVK